MLFWLHIHTDTVCSSGPTLNSEIGSLLCHVFIENQELQRKNPLKEF